MQRIQKSLCFIFPQRGSQCAHPARHFTLYLVSKDLQLINIVSSGSVFWKWDSSSSVIVWLAFNHSISVFPRELNSSVVMQLISGNTQLLRKIPLHSNKSVESGAYWDIVPCFAKADRNDIYRSTSCSISFLLNHCMLLFQEGDTGKGPEGQSRK